MSKQRSGVDGSDVESIRRRDVEQAAAGIISAEQVDALWRQLGGGAASRPTFDLVHLLWYADALVIIGAMGLFTTLAFAQLGRSPCAATGSSSTTAPSREGPSRKCSSSHSDSNPYGLPSDWMGSAWC